VNITIADQASFVSYIGIVLLSGISDTDFFKSPFREGSSPEGGGAFNLIKVETQDKGSVSESLQSTVNSIKEEARA
jgi:hypothetical protein